MTRQRRHRPAPDIDWDTIDYVVGTRADVTRTGINRPCSRCGEPVFTSRHYPDKVSMICEYCALVMVEEEQAAEQDDDAAKRPEPIAGIEPLLDPWQRVAGIRRRSSQTSGRRRLRATPPTPPSISTE
jgi:hypothetical protein